MTRSNSGHTTLPGRPSPITKATRRCTVSLSQPSSGLGARAARRGRGTAAIGLPARWPSATNTSNSAFHVDRALDTDAGA